MTVGTAVWSSTGACVGTDVGFFEGGCVLATTGGNVGSLTGVCVGALVSTVGRVGRRVPLFVGRFDVDLSIVGAPVESLPGWAGEIEGKPVTLESLDSSET